MVLTPARLGAIVLGALAVMGALVMASVSLSASGPLTVEHDCGSVFAPHRYSTEITEPGNTAAGVGSFAARLANRDCNKARSDRRTLALVLGLAGLSAVVGGAFFGGRRGRSGAPVSPVVEMPAA